ncbi:MAG: type-F conjugative transfer system pilin assembly protein TrbC [Pseudomonadota bacterium]
MRKANLIFQIILTCFYSMSAFAGDFNTGTVNEALERAKEYEKKIELPDVDHLEAKKAAKEAAGQFYSPQCQEKIRAETERLKSEQFADILKGYKKPGQAEPADSVLTSDERLYIFISSSVPLSTLRAYAFALDRLNDPNVAMVMRGFVGGMKYFKPTLEFVQNIIVRENSCDLVTEKCKVFNAAISIDPVMFRKYGIRSVPAIAYVKGKSIEDFAVNKGCIDNLNVSQDVYIVSGDLPVDRALEVIAKETGSGRIDNLVKKIRGGFYAD